MTDGGISVDRARWKRELDEFERRTGLDRQWVLRDQFRMLINDLVRFTPPKNQKQGRGAVERDLLKLFVPLTDSMTISTVNLGGSALTRIEDTSDGSVHGVEKSLYRPSASIPAMRAYHSRYRNRRGNVSRSRQIRQQGNWTMVDKMHVSQRAFNAYRKEVWGHIGRLKAGWLAAVYRFGGKAGKFVTRHGTTEGSATDALKQDGSGYLEAVNRVPYARSKIAGVLRFAEQRAQRHIDKRLEKSLERAEKKFNDAKAAA